MADDATTRSVVETYVEAYNDHDLTGLLPLFADEVVQDEQTHDKAELTGAFTVWLNAFPDIAIEPQTLVVDGDTAALFFTVTGTHEDTFLGIEPTGASIEIEEALLFRVEDGAIVRFDAIWDQLGLFTQLGAVEHPLQ